MLALLFLVIASLWGLIWFNINESD
ncbi:MAG: Puff-specific protein Bx42 [Lactococcus lactis]|uniref:Uncharacterized protein n=1 Tax=Lactococcus lactis subsp. lactis A12 TaxID=1137134 RepID=S6EWM9_LACLL|nr:Putative uncharacterized protein [Lactococcus lactis subsp. lactis A12]SBW29559.1 Hypothetical protein LLA12_00384 [Lactococcus lactis subsp. lactis]